MRPYFVPGVVRLRPRDSVQYAHSSVTYRCSVRTVSDFSNLNTSIGVVHERSGITLMALILHCPTSGSVVVPDFAVFHENLMIRYSTKKKVNRWGTSGETHLKFKKNMQLALKIPPKVEEPRQKLRERIFVR